MLNVVVYSENVVDADNYERIIKDSLLDYTIDYTINKFMKMNSKFIKIIKDKLVKKIYVLDTLNENIIRGIRLYDIEGNIILICDLKSKCINCKCNNKYLIFDIVEKNSELENKLKINILFLVGFVFKKGIFVFKYNNTIYRIPYDLINYIEKEPSIKRCIVHTLNGCYYITNSIENILLELGFGFIRTHKSCIVNINNVDKIDLSSNIITFYNDEVTGLLTDKNKNEMKKLLGMRKY